jgi:hypothetical protein
MRRESGVHSIITKSSGQHTPLSHTPNTDATKLGSRIFKKMRDDLTGDNYCDDETPVEYAAPVLELLQRILALETV